MSGGVPVPSPSEEPVQRAFELGHPFAVFAQFAVNLSNRCSSRSQGRQRRLSGRRSACVVGSQVVDPLVDGLALAADLVPHPSEHPRINAGVSQGLSSSISIACSMWMLARPASVPLAAVSWPAAAGGAAATLSPPARSSDVYPPPPPPPPPASPAPSVKR